MQPEQIRLIIECATAIILIGTTLAAVSRYYYAKSDEAYRSLDEKYLEYEKLCLQHPNLDVFDHPQEPTDALNDEQEKQELIIFSILISIFERAYLMYRGVVRSTRKKQWNGWKQYMILFFERENFQGAWAKCGNMFDTDFQKFINEEIKTP
jgi:hypothetical protein